MTKKRPWEGEPDRKEWRHRKVPCLIVRNASGALCGYVGVPYDGKPYRDYSGQTTNDFERALEDASHGGITFRGTCQPGSKICHTPLPGEPEVEWFGFDCAHSGDITPRFDSYPGGFALILDQVAKYRDIGYVTKVCEAMADIVADRETVP